MKSRFSRAWHSPTLMTWGNFAVRSGGLLLLLPMALTRLTGAEIVVWSMFMSIVSMQWLLDLGFSATISRAISHAMAGARTIGTVGADDWRPGDGSPNWALIEQIVATSRRVYVRLAIVLFLLIGTIGSLTLARPVAAVADSRAAWIAWLFVLASSPLGMWANVYANYLEGTNRVALVRRWDALLGLAGLGSGICVLALGGKLLALVVATQSWTIARIVRDRALCHRIDAGRFRAFSYDGYQPQVLRALWPSAWRTGIGSIMSYGLIYGSNLLVAQSGDTRTVASYLVSMRLVDALSQFSMAPFYSQLPAMARMRAANDLRALLSTARRGMVLAHWSYLIGFLALAAGAGRLLEIIGSHAAFAPSMLWALMGLAFFLHRYGAMHVQLYSTTNHVTSHIADFVSGCIFATVALGLFRSIGIFALPIAQIAGYIGFYDWYSARQSYRSVGAGFLSFERAISLPPLAILLAYCAFTAIMGSFT